MLPLLKRKQAASTGLSIQTRDLSNTQEKQEDTDYIEFCCKELIDAIHSKDSKTVASVLRIIFQIADSEPHAEGEHIEPEPHSYDSQK